MLTRIVLVTALALTAACGTSGGGPDADHFKVQRDNTRAGR